MPDTLGIDDCFVPEEVQGIWRVRAGDRLPFVGRGVRNTKIGSGGFGETYAIDGWLGQGLPSFPRIEDAGTTPLERRCCLKIIGKTQLTEPDETYLDRTRLEYQVLLDAHGANGRVPRPLGLGRAHVGGTPYWAIVMEYLPNGNGTYFLSDKHLANDRVRCLPGAVTPSQVATFALQLCYALQDLHTCQGELGITHRDLQPHNVAVRLAPARGMAALPDGTGTVDRVYLIDLGNSTTVERLVTPALGGRAPRAATYQYGAPEVFDMYEDGREGRTWRYRNKPTADVWSLGALVYHYLTGLHPTLCDTSQTAPRDVATLPKEEGLRIPQAQLDTHADDPLTPVLDDLVRRCTTFDPEERARVAQIPAFIATLEAALGKGVASGGVPTRTPDIPSAQTPDLNGAALATVPDAPPAPQTHPVTVGPATFALADRYHTVEATEARQVFARTDADGRAWRLEASWERGITDDAQRKAYANALAERIDALFLHTGTVHGDDALGLLSGAGATVRPGRGDDPAYCVVSLTVPLAGDESFVLRLHLSFAADGAVLLGLGCRCPQESDYDTRQQVADELAALVRTLVLAKAERRR